jgi:proteic killer suppression protein
VENAPDQAMMRRGLRGAESLAARDLTGDAADLLARIDQSVVEDLAALPGNRFEALIGDRKGQYSIRINDQWRICFEWPEGSPGPLSAEIVDYH